MSTRVLVHQEAHDAEPEPFDVQASNVLEAMKMVFTKAPALMQRLLDPGGGHYRAVLSINGRDIRFLQYLDTPLADGDELQVRPLDFSSSVRRSLYLTFGPEKVGNPILHHAGRMFCIEVNILGASVTARKGFVHAVLIGPESEVEAVLSWLHQNGVTLDEAD